MASYYLRYDAWLASGAPEGIFEYLVDSDDDGYWLEIDITDEDGNHIPDVLDDLDIDPNATMSSSTGIDIG